MQLFTRAVFGFAITIASTMLAFATPVVITLNADARNNSVSDPHSASETGGLAPLAVSSLATDGRNGSVFQNVSVGFLGLNQGTFTYDDGWNVSGYFDAGFPSPFANPVATSSFVFTLTTSGSVDVNWSAMTLTALPDNFGLYGIRLFIDGAQPDLIQLTGSGLISMALGAGTHTLEFSDYSDVFTGIGPSPPSIVEEQTTLGFLIHGTVDNTPNGIPEPGTLALLSLGLAGLGVSHRRKPA